MSRTPAAPARPAAQLLEGARRRAGGLAGSWSGGGRGGGYEVAGERGRGQVGTAPTAVARGQVLARDLLLQPDDALEQRLRPRRAPRHVDVDGDDLVDALRDAVRVPVRAAGVGARTERDDVLRLGHLLVEPPDGGTHLVGHGARDAHQVGLPGTVREGDDPEPDEVVPAHAGRDELDRAAGQAEVEDPEAVAAAPVEHELERVGCDGLPGADRGHAERGGTRVGPADRRGAGRDTCSGRSVRGQGHLSAPRRQACSRPTARTPRKTPISATVAQPNSLTTVAQGKRKTASTANST